MQRYDKEQEQFKLQGNGQMEAGDKRQAECLRWNEKCWDHFAMLLPWTKDEVEMIWAHISST